jgi:CRISPR/Cas system CMR-associated protein Cmr3 (group 5 of RAMP superfamily)
MNILKHAIEVEGGVGNLANALGVRQNVVSNWLYRKKLPKPWTIALTVMYARRKVRAA